MIFIERNRLTIPPIFYSKEMEIARDRLESFYRSNKSQRRQKRYNKPFEPELREPIYHALTILFNNKCAYCESIITSNKSRDYDHFRPKSGARGEHREFSPDHYWWLTYEWNNFYLACQECNRYKASWFPVIGKRAKVDDAYEKIIQKEKQVLIDPCIDHPSEHFRFNENGWIDFLSERGEVTIDLLKLNRKALIELRKTEIELIQNEWKTLTRLWKKRDSSWPKITEITNSWNEILSEESKRPFVAALKETVLRRLESNSEIEEYLITGIDKSDLIKDKNKVVATREGKDSTPEVRPRENDDRSKVEVSVAPTNLKINIHQPRVVIQSNQVFLENLELKNYKCFDFLSLSLSPSGLETSENEPWHLILGENGVGKSSILKAISIALLDKSSLGEISHEVHAKKLLKKGKYSGYIKLTYNQGEEIKVNFSSKSSSIETTLKEPLTNIIGYGSIRLLPKGNIQPENNTFPNVRVGNLFDYSVALRDANKWLLSRTQKEFDREATILKELMLLEEDCLLRRRKNEVQVTFPNERPVSIEELSDGYKMVYAMTVDIMSSLSNENVNYDLANGIVLIDEIGTHLHPRWKMQVVERLRRSFPRLQFVVSSHEPLCLRGLKQGEVIVLTKDDSNQIIAIEDLPDPSELRIDQILTSEFFGLKSTFDPKTEQLFDEYYELLAKEEEDRNIDEKSRLLELSQLIPRIKHLGDNTRESLVYHVIDELLAKKVKNEGMKIENLKEEAVDRVANLWNVIAKQQQND